MILHADIKVTRNRIKELHDWLDMFAKGWLYWGSASAGQLTEARTREVMEANNAFAQKSIDAGRGDLWSTVSIVLPNKQAAMAVKLAWPEAEVEKPCTKA